MISIITTVHKNSKSLGKFFERIINQKSSDYELILIIDKNSDSSLKIVDEYKDRVKGQLKLIFNSNRIGRKRAIKAGVNLATREYILILNAADQFFADMVTRLNKHIEEKQTDIIEFSARFKNPVAFQGTLRIKQNKPINISNKKEIIAYSFPFEFNKIYRTNILRDVFKFSSIGNSNPGRYSIELFLKAFLYVESYSTVSEKIVRFKKEDSKSFNPLKLFKEWETLSKSELFSDYISELKYNQYFTSVAFYFAFTKLRKNKILEKNFIAMIKDTFNKDHFFENNKYIIIDNKESNILRKNKSKISDKLLKELK